VSLCLKTLAIIFYLWFSCIHRRSDSILIRSKNNDKEYIVWSSWDEHGPIITKDCGIFTNKKIADDKLNQMIKEDEEDDEEIWSWVSEYELNDQGEYKEVEGEK